MGVDPTLSLARQLMTLFNSDTPTLVLKIPLRMHFVFLPNWAFYFSTICHRALNNFVFFVEQRIVVLSLFYIICLEMCCIQLILLLIFYNFTYNYYELCHYLTSNVKKSYKIFLIC